MILTEILGLKKSARYNLAIKECFERIAERLKAAEVRKVIREQGQSKAYVELIRELQDALQKREKRIATLEHIIRGLKQEIKAGKHTVETGRLVKR